VEAGVDWVEVDTRTTRDGVLMTAHHPTMDDGRFFAQVSAADAAGHGLLRLDDLFGTLPPDVGVNLDLKSSLEDALRPADSTTAAHVARAALAESGRRRVLVSSFDPAALLIVGRLAPSVPRCLLTWVNFPLRKAIAAAAHLGVQVVGPHTGSLGPNESDRAPVHHPLDEAIAVAHEAGLQVAAWCPAPGDLSRLVAVGVVCLVVNDVPAAVAAFEALGCPPLQGASGSARRSRSGWSSA
jgi:glycerophosphoryl diester phosphodiesterase